MREGPKLVSNIWLLREMRERPKLVSKPLTNEPINQIPFIEEQIIKMIDIDDNSIITSPTAVSERQKNLGRRHNKRRIY
jgi:hypothetical protein